MHIEYVLKYDESIKYNILDKIEKGTHFKNGEAKVRGFTTARSERKIVERKKCSIIRNLK